jgi:hypothetical protein
MYIIDKSNQFKNRIAECASNVIRFNAISCGKNIPHKAWRQGENGKSKSH